MDLDLRAWPSRQPIDVERESVFEASRFRDGAPKGASVRVYPSHSYGFVARIDAATDKQAVAQCNAAISAYLPGAPTRHPLDRTPVIVTCHPCGATPPDGTQGLLQ